MLIDVGPIISSDSPLTYSFDDIPSEMADLLSSDIRIRRVATEVIARHVLGRIYVAMDIRCEYDTICARCMDNLSRTVEQHCEQCFVPAGWDEEDVDDSDAVPYSGNQIDLSEMAADGIYTSIPVRDLCVDDCKGICPKCGINLNLGSCDCSHSEIDPRLAGLAKLLE